MWNRITYKLDLNTTTLFLRYPPREVLQHARTGELCPGKRTLARETHSLYPWETHGSGPRLCGEDKRRGWRVWLSRRGWGQVQKSERNSPGPARAHPSIPARATGMGAGMENPAVITPSLPRKPPLGQHPCGNFLSIAVSVAARAEGGCCPCLSAGAGTAWGRRCLGALLGLMPGHAAQHLPSQPASPSLPPALPLPLCSRTIFQLLNFAGEGQVKVRYLQLLLIVSQIPPCQKHPPE